MAGEPWTRRGFRHVTRNTDSLPATTSETLFTITGGPVRVSSIIGEVTTVIQTQANNTKLIFNPTGTGTSTDICAVLDITGDAVGTIYTVVGVLATALKSTTVQMAVPADSIPWPGYIFNLGTIELSCAATNTGSVKWYVEWMPLAPESDLYANQP